MYMLRIHFVNHEKFELVVLFV